MTERRNALDHATRRMIAEEMRAAAITMTPLLENEAHRTIPYDYEAEQDVLSACLCGSVKIAELGLAPVHFAVPLHRALSTALASAPDPTDLNALVLALEHVTGPVLAALEELRDLVPFHLPSFVHLRSAHLRDLHQKRHLLSAFEAISVPLRLGLLPPREARRQLRRLCNSFPPDAPATAHPPVQTAAQPNVSGRANRPANQPTSAQRQPPGPPKNTPIR